MSEQVKHVAVRVKPRGQVYHGAHPAPYREGDVVSLPEDHAAELLAAGHVELHKIELNKEQPR